MRREVTKEWCLKMAQLETNTEIGAGRIAFDPVFDGDAPPVADRFKVGDRARKVGGSCQATGTIRVVFLTRNGEQRFVFEFDELPGLLHIFGPAQIEPMVDE